MKYEFRRYVAGVEMAEGVTIERAASLDEAMQKAAALCSPAPMTVLVLVEPAALAPARCGHNLDEGLYCNRRAGHAGHHGYRAAWEIEPVSPDE